MPASNRTATSSAVSGSRFPDDLSAFLAERAATASLEDIGSAAVSAAKRAIVDTLGVCLAGTAAAPEYIDPIRSYLRKYASPGNAPALCLGTRVAPLDVVFWQGSLAHVADFDDLAGYSHPSGPVVSAVLPLAYLTDRPVDGARLLAAVAVGQDLVVRIAEVINRPMNAHGWLPSLPGALGAALACARLLDLDAERTRNALGLALHSTSGTMQAIAGPGSAYRAIRDGKDARAGAVAALLAAEGLPGDPLSMEGQFGLFPQFFSDDYDRELARTPQFLGAHIAVKAWPCAGYPQLYLTAVDALVRRGDVRVDEVTRIKVTGWGDLLPHECSPLSERAAPKRSIDAKVSIPFLIGKLLRNRTLVLADFTPQGLHDPDAIALARRVEWEMDANLQRGPADFGVGRVEIEHRDGTVVWAETETPLGHPDAPLSWADLVEKFRTCAFSASVPIPQAAADKVVSLVADIEAVADTTVILETLFEGTGSPENPRPAWAGQHTVPPSGTAKAGLG